MFAKIFEIKMFKLMQTYAYALDAMLNKQPTVQFT